MWRQSRGIGGGQSSTPNCPYGIIEKDKHAPREHYRDGLLRQLELSRFGQSVNTAKDVVNSADRCVTTCATVLWIRVRAKQTNPGIVGI